MSTAHDGRRREWKVRDHMAANGWVLISRSAGSKGPADLIMAHPFHGVALVQVGTGNKVLGPADRKRLVDAGVLCSALTILATVVPRQGISYREVTVGLPKTWAEWRP